MSETKTFDPAKLQTFKGSPRLYRFGISRRVSCTEGALYVAQTAGAFWLLDHITGAQAKRAVKAQAQQCWKLTVEGERGELTCTDGNLRVIYKQEMHTDFPEPGIRLYFEDNTIMLPQER